MLCCSYGETRAVAASSGLPRSCLLGQTWVCSLALQPRRRVDVVLERGELKQCKWKERLPPDLDTSSVQHLLSPVGDPADLEDRHEMIVQLINTGYLRREER